MNTARAPHPGDPDAGEYEGSVRSAPSVQLATPPSEASVASGHAAEITAPPSQNSVYVPPHLRGVAMIEKGHAEAAEAKVAREEADKKLAALQIKGRYAVPLPYVLNKDQLAEVTKRHPKVTFTCGDTSAHDHPVLHTDTLIGANTMYRLVPGGSNAIDLFGSPKKCDALNRQQRNSRQPKHIRAHTALMTEKDYIRALDFGDPFHEDGTTRYLEGTGDVIDDMFEADDTLKAWVLERDGPIVWYSVHTLYYLTDLQIARLLRVPKSRMLALIHRHKEAVSGTLGAGEATYAKKNGMVEQTNVLTGERYVHRDLSYLWESKTKVVRTAAGAYTWTFQMVSEESWIIRLAGCPNNLDERFAAREKALGTSAACHELNEHDLVPTSFPHPALGSLPKASCRMVAGVPVVKINGDGDTMQLRVTCTPLLEFLTRAMVGKPRDTDRLNDLFALARAHVAGGNDFAGKMNFVCNASDIKHHVILAFISGIEEETELLRALSGYQVWTKEHHAHLDGSALVVNVGAERTPSTVVALLNRVNAARKSGDVVDGVLRALQ